MAKFYAVRKGFNTDIYTNWAEAEKNVKGFSGAEFAKFSTLSDACTFMENTVTKDEAKTMADEAVAASQSESEQNIISDLFSKYCTNLIAFVDGSFNASDSKIGSGIVLLYPNGTIKKFSLTINTESEELIGMRNVSGEIMAAQRAALIAEKERKSITIFHDYEGVAKWVNGEWKAKKPETKKYQDAMADLMKRIEIKFVKVPAHAGVHFNELADRLAKDACNL